MTFQLFGFDFIPMDKLYGIWIAGIRWWKPEKHRALFCVYYAEEEWVIELFYMRLTGSLGW